MAVSADVLRTHLNYSAWASGLLVDAAARLNEDELTRDFATSDKNVLRTLVHVFAADRIWLARIRGAPATAFVTDADYHLEVLQKDWPALMDDWKQWAAGLSDDTAQAVISHSDLRGKVWQQAVWQIVLHVVNHGTHHRGQAAGFLRAMGHTPPPLDLVRYYRSLPQT
jgi:uncharacterized damage-inducible protein DinB